MTDLIQIPRATLQDVQDRLESVGEAITNLKKLEPTLVFFHENLEFFKIIIPTLNSRLTMLEHAVTIGLPAQISQQILPDKTDIINQISTTTLSTTRNELQNLRQTMDDFRRDATATWATKSDLEVVKAESTGVLHTSSNNKSKVPAPSPFSGKREEWKTFSSHLSLYFTANSNQYPSDTDKILFAISRLGNGSAFKFMEQYIPDFNKPTATRPLLISNYDTFIDTLSENFGIQNAHVVAEAQLRSLQQRGSAMDYTNRFLELAAETNWNDSAKISQYRLGLKDAVQDVLALADEPTDFATFTSKAINIDKRQYARHVEKKTSQNSSRTSTSSASSAPRTHQTSAQSASTPTNTPQPADATASTPDMAMDLSYIQHRPVDAEEKKRRKDNNLCSYCAADDHWVKECPTKPSFKPKTTHSVSAAQISPDFTFTLEDNSL